MRGETLYPLNALRAIYPDVYERARSKYVGRERVMDFRIPILDVLWNDTLHLSPLHPFSLASVWRAVGLEQRSGFRFWDREFFQIPLDRIAGRQSVWFASEAFWVNNAPNEDVPLAPPVEEFRSFEPAEYEELTEVPPSYEAYLRRQLERHRPALQFPKIPHVLVAGPIDVAGLNIVRANAPPR